ncbi:MAG: hypothetical protein EZS28_007572 [Streblomastix strix]|uniref:Uncharacterized protein n=1 Tax=Streblomastix strix TaxID=222440 RepID=A0A5J4WPW3_9EUKA|nr:MAG: hypothetical protein EZS28_007572 [Streblomastix strix]
MIILIEVKEKSIIAPFVTVSIPYWQLYPMKTFQARLAVILQVMAQQQLESSICYCNGVGDTQIKGGDETDLWKEEDYQEFGSNKINHTLTNVVTTKRLTLISPRTDATWQFSPMGKRPSSVQCLSQTVTIELMNHYAVMCLIEWNHYYLIEIDFKIKFEIDNWKMG